MADVTAELANIRAAVLGIDVRDSIANGIEGINTEVVGTTAKQAALETTFDALVINAGSSNAEIVAARGSAVDLPTRLGGVDAQLAESATIVYVEEKVAGLVSGTPKGTYTTLALLQAAHPTNDGNIYIVAGYINVWGATTWEATNIQYQSTGIADKSVTQEKTSFFKLGKNLFDKTKNVTFGYYVNNATGELGGGGVAAYYASDFILVLPSTQYTYSPVATQSAFYDSNHVYISGTVATGTIMTPSNCAYIRVSAQTLKIDISQFELGGADTSYEPYHQYIEDRMIENAIGSVTSKMTDFAMQSRNLFDKDDATQDFYVNNTTGALSTNTAYATSEHIPVIPATIYTATIGLYLAFYTSAQVFISGLSVAADLTVPRTITTPTNAYFVRLSVQKTGLNTFQFELGSVANPYESFGYRFIRQTGLSENILLNLAPVIPALVGCEVNVYYSNIMSVDNIDNYKINIICARGKQQRERWTYIPEAGEVGDVSITFEVYQKGVFIAKISGIVRTSAISKGTGQTLKVGIHGDSTTFNNTMITELANVLSADVLDVTFIGTGGIAPNFHEGYSGTTTDWHFTNVASPFVYSGVFNYATYLSTHSLATPDIVMLNLGINDMFAPTDDAGALAVITSMITQYDAMIENIKLSNANMKFGICVTVPSGGEDAFAQGYGCGQNSWRYNRNNRLLTNALINYFKGKEAQNIHLVPINVNLDTVNNIGVDALAPISSRNPLMIARQNNGVHPGLYGYYQIADVDYYWIKSMAT